MLPPGGRLATRQHRACRSVSGALPETQRFPPIPIPTFAISEFLLLTSPAAAHEAEVVEPGHLVLHDSGSVAQLGGVILVIARHHRHHRSIRNIPQCHHLRKEDRLGRPNGGAHAAARLGPRLPEEF